MKILKLPVETKIICGCGCEFVFDMDDIIPTGTWMGGNQVHSTLMVECPFCKYRHTIQNKTIQYPTIEHVY